MKGVVILPSQRMPSRPRHPSSILVEIGLAFLRPKSNLEKGRVRIGGTIEIRNERARVQGEEKDDGRGGYKDSERNESCWRKHVSVTFPHMAHAEH